MTTKEIPDIIVSRLPIYLRALQSMLEQGIQSTSSQELGERVGISAAQIRKDLSQFGEFGKQGTGYHIPFLVDKLKHILHVDRLWDVAVIGMGDIGHAIQSFAESRGCSIVREFCGHGIGAKFHEEPQVLHYGRAGTGLQLKAGMIFTVEPMINAGKAPIRQLADGWTIVTKDHSLSAQWEHTVLVTAAGYEVLTLSAGAPPKPAFSS